MKSWAATRPERRRAITEAFIVNVFVSFLFSVCKKASEGLSRAKDGGAQEKSGIKKINEGKNRRGKREVKA